MPAYTSEDIRNVALVGHGGSGKTTLVEAMLLQAGAIASMGDVTKGSMVCDFEPEEKEHGHSLSTAVASLDHDGAHINFVDTPGYPDFIGRALSSLVAVETVAVVVDARSGIEMTTHRMMQAAGDRGLARMVVISKIDSDDIDLEGLLGQVIDAFGKECLPINLPSRNGQEVVDCFFNPSEGEVDFSSVEDAHTHIVEQVVEVDEELMELYLEHGDELAPEKLHEAFGQALREGHLVPVCFVSGETGAGVPELMNVLAKLMPNPSEGNPAPFQRGEERLEVAADAQQKALAHVFKVSIDAFVGKLGIFRVHRGTVTKDTQLYVGDARKPFKIGHLFKLQGKEHVEIDAGVPGDICAVAKIDEIQLDAVLAEAQGDVELTLDGVNLPEPMYGLAIEAKARGDEQKLGDSLGKLAAEDPCFRVEHNVALNETVIRGLGDLHLRVMLEKMKGRYNVEVDTRVPRIEYRETVRKSAEGHHRHKKQTGGAGQFGEVYLRIEPLSRGVGFEFVDKVVGGVIPSQFIPAVEKGIRQVLDGGAVAGYPLQDVRVTVYDGKFHAVDSKEVAFIQAGKKAFIDAVGKAGPVVLEPIVSIDVTVPQDNMGDIAGGLSSKRGRVNGTTTLAGGMVRISGQAPLSELSAYQSELKSLTGGAGSYTMEFSHYDPVPPPIQQQLQSDFKPAADEE